MGRLRAPERGAEKCAVPDADRLCFGESRPVLLGRRVDRAEERVVGTAAEEPELAAAAAAVTTATGHPGTINSIPLDVDQSKMRKHSLKYCDVSTDPWESGHRFGL